MCTYVSEFDTWVRAHVNIDVCVFMLILAHVCAQAPIDVGGCRLCLSIFEFDIFMGLVFVHT